MEKKNIRIKDIAQRAGVSIGTVDRVLHNRGKVSEEALQRVLSTLREIDYKPNLIARTLGTKRTYRIVVILPDPALDEYWAQSNQGVAQATTEWQQYDVQVEPYFFHLYDKNSFKNIAQKAFRSQPDGIVIAPIFYQEALHFFDECDASNIPVVVYNTNIPEGKPLSFIGQNLYESGKVAAALINLGQTGAGNFAILHINEDRSNSIHLLEKERGFKEYFETNHRHHHKIIALNLSGSDETRVNHEIENLLADEQLKGILVTTSKGIAITANLLQKHGKHNIRLIGYDLLKENIAYLQAGIIDFLINQNSKHQAFLGIQHLANYLFLKKIPPALNLLPLEIITRENLDSYLGSSVHYQ